MTFSLRFHAHSEVGRIRKNNQDAGYASPHLLLVADGMGGAAAGDLASAVVATAARGDDTAVTAEAMEEHMLGLLERANGRLSELIDDDPTLDGMGTTFCGAAFDGTTFGLTHIGDSRCYLLRDGALEQLTRDHSWVQSLIDEGRLTPAQAAVHPHRSLILKVLNGQPSMTPDYSEVEAKLGDRIMFCSDGLSGLIDDDLIAELLAEEDADLAIMDLAEAANRAGGHDNITVVVADVVAFDEALASAEPQLVGSAAERDIPVPGEPVTEPAGPGYPAAPAPTVDHDEAEVARYAPANQRQRWPSIVAAIVAIALVIGGATWGVIAYSKSRYFIAESEGHVAIFNGLPGSLLGQELNSLTERRATAVVDLPKFYQRAVANTIGVGSIDAARATADQLQVYAERCVAAREERTHRTPTPAPTPTPSGLSTGQPNYPTYLAPITPTATEEADPEAC